MVSTFFCSLAVGALVGASTHSPGLGLAVYVTVLALATVRRRSRLNG